MRFSVDVPDAVRADECRSLIHALIHAAHSEGFGIVTVTEDSAPEDERGEEGE